MRILVLGGTAWLGGEVARYALREGHAVTCLARGSSGDVPSGVRLVRSDRTTPGAYAQVGREQPDVVIDVSRQPGQVRSAVEALEAVGCYVFVSSSNVYADLSRTGQDEDVPLLPPLQGDVMESMDSYGPAKVACEQAVGEAFGPDRSLIARVGLIGGPGDIFDRTGYWPWRFSRPATRDGAVLVPDDPDLVTQVVDVRDLAAWLVESGARRRSGVFNVTGEPLSLSEHLETARGVAGHTGPVVRADPEELIARGVQPWMGERSLPLWLHDPAERGINAFDSTRARASGLVSRPLRDTLRDTLAWELGRPSGRVRRAGLTDEDHQALLDELPAAGQTSAT
jgi:nucleoside-diphosphate-sugar epimerase